MQSPYYQAALKDVRRANPEMANLPDTDIRVLDQVKKRFDGMIGKYDRSGDNYKKNLYMQAKQELLGQIDPQVPQYAQARQAFGDNASLKELVETGRNYGTLTREELADLMNKSTPQERRAINAGIREQLVKMLDRSAKTEGTNVAQRVFDLATLQKLERAGTPNFNAFRNAVNAERQAGYNLGRLQGGSQTAQREYSAGKVVMSPKRSLKRFLSDQIDKVFNKNQTDMARLLTDPEYLLQMRSAAQALGKNTPGRVNISGAGLPFANIAGPKTSAEKGVVRKYVQDQLMKNVRNTSVYNPSFGKEVRFNRVGIDKAIGSTNEEGKLKMLNNLPSITEKATPYQYPKTYGRERYDYLMTPVRIDGRNTGAAITLRNGYVYNLNPAEYAINNRSIREILNKESSGVIPETSGSQPRTSNSIANYMKKVKALRNAGKRAGKDLLINTARPAYVGQTAEILRQGRREEK